MKECIEREAAIQLANNHKDGTIDANDIARIPTADVRPVVRGEWRKSELFNDHPECPVCSYVSGERNNFCPQCGADMRGGSAT